MLIKDLAKINPKNTAIINEEGEISYGEIVSSAFAVQKKVRGKRVVINVSNLFEGVKCLIASDNCAKAIALIAPSNSLETLKILFIQFKPDIVITDNSRFFEDCGFNSYPKLSNEIPDSSCKSSINTDWVMSTSGTTSTPKLVVHDLKSIKRTVRQGLSGSNKIIWGMLYDYTRFAGIQVIMQALLSGAKIIQPPSKINFKEQLSFLTQHHCNHLSATPTMWRKILMSGIEDLLTLERITLGGEIADDRLLQLLQHKYPSAKIRHIYASTESGVGFSVSDGKAGFPSSLLSDNNYGVELKILKGNLWVKNKLVNSRYLNSKNIVSTNGWINTGDRVILDGDRFFFLGRDSGLINVGGNKVHPEQIEGVILSHPDIQLARVYEIKNPIIGALVAADVVLNKKVNDDFIQSLEEFLASRLDRYQRPVSINIVKNMGISTSGKIER